MFRSKTVLILGAGASAEVGMPVGTTLLTNICELLDIRFDSHGQIGGDHVLVRALREYLNEGREVDKVNAHIRMAHQIRQSAIQGMSIDNILDALENPEAELLGKLAIVRAIHLAESESDYFQFDANDHQFLSMQKFAQTWYKHLTQLLVERVRKSDVDEVFQNLTVINFNYDRCLERYLSHSLASYFGLELKEARELVCQLRVFRPYGSVGRLGWQSGSGPAIEFGNPRNKHLVDVAHQIRTFTEQQDDGDKLEGMRRAIAEADRIVFLGFAFHRQNVELLKSKAGKAQILATVHNISRSDQSVIRAELGAAFVHPTANKRASYDLAEATCVRFFQDYWRTLTA